MIDLKKLIAVGAVCTIGTLACDVEDDPEAGDDAGLECPAGDGTDGTVPATCVPGEGDAGEVCTCGDGGAGGGGMGGDGGGGTPTGGVEPPAPTATTEWTDSKTLVLTITANAEIGPYQFGLAETGNGGGDGWDGEDCIEGVQDDYDLCHAVPAAGTLTLTSVHPDEGGTIDDLMAGSTTLMNQARAPGITYVLIRDTDDANCWTWGHNPQHYIEELGCNELQ